MTPAVSFVVPCYKLAHLLPDCVASILSQSYADFEVLIMDDCSPDNTPQVAQSFHDPRVKHIRNDPNLGHLRNYNKGITMARGRYIWLISADDRLRSQHVLRRYLHLMDRRPDVGFAFCRAVAIRDGEETEIVQRFSHGDRDLIFDGHAFLERLRMGNCVAAPSVLVRKNCYDRILFPLDLPNTGDWFLWCAFSMDYNVAYFAESMVGYRYHETQMTSWFLREARQLLDDNELLLRLHVMTRAQRAALPSIAAKWEQSLADVAAYQIVRADSDACAEFIASKRIQSVLNTYVADGRKRAALERRIRTSIGDLYYDRGIRSKALSCYATAIRRGTLTPKVLAKFLLFGMGPIGSYVINASRMIRSSRARSERLDEQG